MRKKQLMAVGGLAVLFVLIVILTQTVGKKVATNALCQSFIVGIENGDVSGTYEKMSPRLQAQITQAYWKIQVDAIKGQFGTTAPELQSRTAKKDSSNVEYSEEVHKINNGSGPYTATCQIIDTEKGNRIDVFTSRINT